VTADAARPRAEERERDDRQADGQAEPQADHAEPAPEESTEPIGRPSSQVAAEIRDRRGVRVAHAAGAVRVRNDVVEAEEEAAAEDRDREEEISADAHRTDRRGANAAGEHGVDDPHRHPADLGDDYGTGEARQRAQLGGTGVG
jgi:hypothetical protein